MRGWINPYLVGPRAKIVSLAREHGVEIAPYPIVDVADDLEAAQRGVELCRVNTCQALMNGSLHPDHFLQPIMAEDTGLRLKRRMSHTFVVDVPSYLRTLIILNTVSLSALSYENGLSQPAVCFGTTPIMCALQTDWRLMTADTQSLHFVPVDR